MIMRDRTSLAPRVAMLATVIACLALAPALNAQSARNVAEVRFGSAGVELVPVVEYSTLVLTVSGPDGFYHQAELGAGETPILSLFDKAGNVLADGIYKYELRVGPAEVRSREVLGGTQGLEGRPASGAARIQYGTFSIQGGAFVDAAVQEPGPEAGRGAGSGENRLAAKDFVILDDLIVDGSACIGFDCVNGESFGFDTIRLKENNLRIKFDDTSTAASFPRNDWQITANDSANGGASKFSIDDISGSRTPFTIEAGARSHSLYVDEGGRLGLRTSTPSTEIHTIDGDTPTLRLQQDGSSGFAPQTWDVAGNETNFFIRDVTNGSKLPFRIRPGAPTSSIYIDVDGDVGFGTSSPDFDLDIDDGTSDPANFVVRGTSGSMILQDQDATSGRQAAQNLVSAGTWRLRGLSDDLSAQTVRGITVDLADGDVGILCDSSLSADLTVGSQGSCSSGTRSTMNAGDTTFTASSSRTIKKDVKPLRVDDILDRIGNVAVYEYDFIEGPEDRIGLMAEDFHQVFQRGSDQLLSGQEVQMALWLAVQELTTRLNEEHAAELERLTARQKQADREIQHLKELLAALVE